MGRLTEASERALHAPSMQVLIATLMDPASYPAETGPIEFRETHASCVFLTRNDAYKLKKPVNLGFLNYSTQAKRRLMCTREVRLNRRLAPDVYIGVVPLTLDGGKLRVNGTGTVVDYLVHMRRLPDDMTLRSLVERGSVGSQDVRAIARFLAAFHAAAATGPRIARYGLPGSITRNVNENFKQTRRFVGRALSEQSFLEILAYTQRFLRRHRHLFEDRVAAGYVRDGHGDLRAEHIYLDDRIRIIDCIEFNNRFRYADVLADLAFLAMDLDALGAPDLADALFDEYGAASGAAPASLLNFYRCYRAFTRAKVACFRTEDAMPDGDLVALLEAKRYFHLALRYARGERRPRLLLIGGLPGSGKTTLARAIGSVVAASVVSADATRKRLAGVCREERRHEPFDTGLYSPEMNAKVYGEMLARADEALSLGRSAVLDATYRRRSDRERARELAIRRGAEFLAIECTASDETARKRLEIRERHGGDWSDATWETYIHLRRQFEPFSELPHRQRLGVDSELPIEAQVDCVLGRLEGRDLS